MFQLVAMCTWWIETIHGKSIDPAYQARLVKTDMFSASIAESLSTASTQVNLAQLAAWNPNIIGACDHLAGGQYICVG